MNEKEFSQPKSDSKGSEQDSFSSAKKDSKYWLFAMKIVVDFGFVLAVPVVVFVMTGRWLDAKYDSGPWLTLLAFVLAALVSGAIIYKKAKRYGKEYMELDNK